jgi:hypothetical protein
VVIEIVDHLLDADGIRRRQSPLAQGNGAHCCRRLCRHSMENVDTGSCATDLTALFEAFG